MTDGYTLTGQNWVECDRIIVTVHDGTQLAIVREHTTDVIDTRGQYVDPAEAYRVRIEPRRPGMPHPQVFTGPHADNASRAYQRASVVDVLTAALPVPA